MNEKEKLEAQIAKYIWKLRRDIKKAKNKDYALGADNVLFNVQKRFNLFHGID